MTAISPTGSHRTCATGCGKAGTVRITSADVGSKRWRAEEVRHVCVDCAAKMRGEAPVRLEDLPPVQRHEAPEQKPGSSCPRCGKPRHAKRKWRLCPACDRKTRKVT